MSSKSIFKRLTKGTPAKPKPQVPRDTKTINKEYTELAQILGDVTVKVEAGKKQQLDILARIDNLGGELNARLKLDADEKAKNPTEEKKDADAGITTPNSAA